MEHCTDSILGQHLSLRRNYPKKRVFNSGRPHFPLDECYIHVRVFKHTYMYIYVSGILIRERDIIPFSLFQPSHMNFLLFKLKNQKVYVSPAFFIRLFNPYFAFFCFGKRKFKSLLQKYYERSHLCKLVATRQWTPPNQGYKEPGIKRNILTCC